MNANVDINLMNYLKNNLDRKRYALIQNTPNEANQASALAAISTLKLPNDILCLIKEFLKNKISREEISEYINRTNDAGRNIFFFCKMSSY